MRKGWSSRPFDPGYTLIARIRLTDARGNPIGARVHPPYLTWSVAAGSVPQGSDG